LAFQDSFALTIIANDAPVSTALTSTTEVPAENGILVRTRLPFNHFDYTAGATVRVTGRLHMQLVEDRMPGLRRLGSTPVEEELSPPYEVIIALKEEGGYREEEYTNSAEVVSLRRVSLLVCVCVAAVFC
jgi:hypothetical protein